VRAPKAAIGKTEAGCACKGLGHASPHSAPFGRQKPATGHPWKPQAYIKDRWIGLDPQVMALAAKACKHIGCAQAALSLASKYLPKRYPKDMESLLGSLRVALTAISLPLAAAAIQAAHIDRLIARYHERHSR